MGADHVSYREVPKGIGNLAQQAAQEAERRAMKIQSGQSGTALHGQKVTVDPPNQNPVMQIRSESLKTPPRPIPRPLPDSPERALGGDSSILLESKQTRSSSLPPKRPPPPTPDSKPSRSTSVLHPSLSQEEASTVTNLTEGSIKTSKLKKIGTTFKSIFGGKTKAANESSSLRVSEKGTKQENASPALRKFLVHFEEQIRKDEAKLSKLKNQLLAENGKKTPDKQVVRDLSAATKKLEEVISDKRAAKSELVIQGDKLLGQLSPGDISDAKMVIKQHLRHVEKTTKEFEKGAETLITKTVGTKTETGKKFLGLLQESVEESRMTIKESKERYPHVALWGVSARYKDTGDGKKGFGEQATSSDMVQEVNKPTRTLAAVLIPNFAKQFHQEIVCGTLLKAAIEKSALSVVVPPSSDFTEVEMKRNLDYFTNLTGDPEKGKKINDSYRELWSAYDTRGAKPMLYLDSANKFIDLYKQAIEK